MEGTVDIGKGKQAVLDAVLQALAECLVVDHSRDKGRIALGHVVLGLAPFVRILLGGGRKEGVGLAECWRVMSQQRHVDGTHAAIAAAPAGIRRRLALVGVLLYAALCPIRPRSCLVEARRERVDVEVQQGEPRAGGCRLGGC